MRRPVCDSGLGEEIRKSKYTSHLTTDFLHGKGKSFIPGQIFSEKGQVVNILGCVGHAFSVSPTQLWWGSVKAATDKTEMSVWLCLNKTIYQNRQQATFGPRAVI